MLGATPVHPTPNRRRLLPRVVLVAAVVLCVLAIVAFFGVGRWLVIEDPLEKAPAIVVLSGAMPIRATEAARLYRAGYAPQVWLTRAREPTASLQAMHIAYIGEDFFSTQVLMHEGVPANAVRVLEPAIDNTADEVKAISDELARENFSSVIIVTTKVHTRRIRALWNHLASGRAIVRACQDDAFEPARWWRTSKDALDVVREVLGMLNVWAGLPLRPSN